MNTTGVLYIYGQAKTWKGEKNMVKKNLIRAKIAEKESNYIKCAEAIGVSTTTFSSKINGHTLFTINQAKLLSHYLELTLNEMRDIFLM